MSDQGYGHYAGGGGSAVAIDGAFTATIKNMEVIASEKPRMKITVTIDDGSEFDGETLTRVGGISFGMNSESKKWAWFAQYIQAATGIPCGDPAQKKAPKESMVGKRVRIKVMHDDEKGYNNIIAFGAIQAQARPQVVPDRTPVQRPPIVDNTGPVTVEALLSGVSASEQRRIAALAEAKKIGLSRLALLIASIVGGVGVELLPANVPALVDALKAERAA